MQIVQKLQKMQKVTDDFGAEVYQVQDAFGNKLFMYSLRSFRFLPFPSRALHPARVGANGRANTFKRVV